ncbi:tagatose-6-phosphate kinase [Amycolatopsis rubida]|uniref:Tagatose-1,6-bisphosphate aldolase non-catalytic subunit AgaZ/GatZ n=1 Tax=Amycolatopsis rubida TaxID=112413 RepID=A0A1I5VDY1_9PSEU|nr:tagatose-6-phosphate kinase [Amycolatopsis rubida]SFQ05778.1 Tagatose-1,6-bisphosphate aldolase non-catalytic subunit AgaZ/GatZ [Amycolatopsis rubida]
MTRNGPPRMPTLGVGPMSKNAVDATVELARDHDTRIMLIPSRRQVESAALGGGYVERWTTDEFAGYVRDQDKDGLLLLCRDHGGPWQHPAERAGNYSEEQAMAASLASFRADIEAGFDLLHIDTCLDLDGSAALERAIARLVKLYGECHETARELGREVRFEIGFEGQGVDTNDPAEFRDQVTEVCSRLAADRLPAPEFVVAQTGTKVLETENTGALLTAPSAVGFAVAQLARVCADVGSSLKAHNADYLPAESLRRLMQRGVAAVNVAPEFGVVETRALLELLDELGLAAERDEFLRIAHASGAWRKWLKPGTTTSDHERAVIAGHYVFATGEFRELKDRIAAQAPGIDLDARLRAAVYAAQLHYLVHTGASVAPVLAESVRTA